MPRRKVILRDPTSEAGVTDRPGSGVLQTSTRNFTDAIRKGLGITNLSIDGISRDIQLVSLVQGLPVASDDPSDPSGSGLEFSSSGKKILVSEDFANLTAGAEPVVLRSFDFDTNYARISAFAARCDNNSGLLRNLVFLVTATSLIDGVRYTLFRFQEGVPAGNDELFQGVATGSSDTIITYRMIPTSPTRSAPQDRVVISANQWFSKQFWTGFRFELVDPVNDQTIQNFRIELSLFNYTNPNDVA